MTGSFIGDPRPFCNQKMRRRESASIKRDTRNAEKAALAKKENRVCPALITQQALCCILSHWHIARGSKCTVDWAI
jgi:hypothetical protein